MKSYTNRTKQLQTIIFTASATAFLLLMVVDGADPLSAAETILRGSFMMGFPMFTYEGPKDKGGGTAGGGDGGGDSAGGGGGGDADPGKPAGGSQPSPGAKAEGYDAENDPLLLEAMEATKKHVQGEEYEEPPKKKSEEEDDPTPSKKEEKSKEEKKKGDKEGETPKGEDSEEGEGEYNEQFDPNDLVEVEGEKYFYHPDEHGKDSGQGTMYKDRNTAEYGLPNKVKKIEETLAKLKETDRGVGPVKLPEWVEKAIEDPDALAEYKDIDFAISQTNEDLRKLTSEADRAITDLTRREEQLTTRKQEKETSEELENLVRETADQALTIREDLGYNEQELKGFRDIEALKQDAKERVNNRIAEEIKPLAEKYEKLKKADADERMEDDYPERLEEAREAVRKKESELREDYTAKYLDGIDELEEKRSRIVELEQGRQNEDGLSESQLQEQQVEAFSDLQDYLAEMPQDQQPDWFRASTKKGLEHFWNWATARASKYGDLTSSFYFRKAADDYEQHLEERRAEIRRQKIEEENKKEEKKRKEIPGYGNQEEIDPKKGQKTKNKFEEMSEESEALMKETEQALKS